MKKVMFGVIIAMMFLSMIGAVSAAPGQVIVAGKIYNSDFTAVVPNALVEVTCRHNEVIETLNTTSLEDGSYSVIFNNNEVEVIVCDINDELNVHAIRDDIGENTIVGTVNVNMLTFDLGLGVVNVPLIPEFGLIASLATIVGAMGMFFYIRKK